MLWIGTLIMMDGRTDRQSHGICINETHAHMDMDMNMEHSHIRSCTYMSFEGRKRIGIRTSHYTSLGFEIFDSKMIHFKRGWFPTVCMYVIGELAFFADKTFNTIHPSLALFFFFERVLSLQYIHS